MQNAKFLMYVNNILWLEFPMKLSSSVHPYLVGELLRTLSNMGVDTVRQLLARDPHLLAARTGVDLNTVRDIRCTCLAAYPEEAVSLVGWDRNETEKEVKITSGVPQLDELLSGGLLPGRIYEMYGPPGSGKTQLCLTLTAHCIIQNGLSQRNVAYIDTKGDFRVSRLVEILRHNWSKMRGHVGVLDRVRVRRVFDISVLEKDLERAVDVAERGLCDGDGCQDEVLFWLKLKLAIVDSIAAIVLPELGDGKVRSAFLKVERIVRLLRRLSELTGACVLVTNHATRRDIDEGGSGDQSHNFRPSLGKLFSGAADSRLFVRRIEERNSTKRTVLLEKSFLGVTGSKCRIQIGKGGWESESL